MKRMLMFVVGLSMLIGTTPLMTDASRTEASAADSLRTVRLRIEGMT
jgi:hypothetical protein